MIEDMKKHDFRGGPVGNSLHEDARSVAPPRLHDLYASPEFLFRRAHQIASAAFADACRHLDLTPSQYSALFVLREINDVSQNELGRLVALDRSTMSIVLRSLTERRLVREHPDPSDKRKKRLQLSDTGRLILAEAERLSARSSENMLHALGEEKAQQLLSLLEQLAASGRLNDAA
jgi:MarR family transcriptional regulator, lower aerobic nicotinate degradation pathway regulator